jgi:hypothetical protein
MSETKRPTDLTNPTYEEYDEAYDRLMILLRDNEQAHRDFRTLYWYGWNAGHDAGKRDRS